MNPLPYPPDRPENEWGEVTTVWSTGEVVRVKPNGAQQQRESVPAVKREESE